MSNCSSLGKSAINPLTTRGIQNPRVIDLIREEKVPTPAVVLVMMEDRSWSGTSERLDEFGAKCNNYLDYVLDGWLLTQHPQYKSHAIVFELVSKTSLSGPSAVLFEQFTKFVSAQGIICRAEVEAALDLSAAALEPELH